MKKTTTKKPNKKLSELLLNPNVKSTWAEYADSLLTPKYYVCRYDDKKGNRFYYFKKDEETIIAAGVTTVFGLVSTERERINEWKNDHTDWKHLLDVSSEYGNRSHIQKGNIMFGKGVDMAMLEEMTKMVVDNGGNYNTPAKDMLAFIKFQEDFQLTPLLIEASLVWQDPVSGEWLAQTIDLLAKMTVTIKTKTTVEDGVYQRGDKKGEVKYKDVTTETKEEKVLLIDFKSNFFEKDKKSFFEVHKMQLMAGKLAVEQNFDIKVDDIYNFAENSWRTEPSYTFSKWTVDDSDWAVFNAYWKLAQTKGINQPQGKMLITEGFKDSKDFKFLSYKEYVEQVLMKAE
jgi:hypothetical protein